MTTMLLDPGLIEGQQIDQGGVGSEAEEIRAVLADAQRHYLLPAIRQRETIEAKFRRLALEWRSETEYVSSPAEIAIHRSYQEIIGMGRDAVPLVLSELSQKPDHWFWALQAITGVDPVRPDSRGDLRRMAEDWLQWASLCELSD